MYACGIIRVQQLSSFTRSLAFFASINDSDKKRSMTPGGDQGFLSVYIDKATLVVAPSWCHFYISADTPN